MRECKKIRNMMTEIINNEICAEDRLLFFKHLEHCSSCSKEYQDIKDLMLSLKSYTRFEPPAEFWNNYWHNLKPRLKSAAKQKNILSLLHIPVQRNGILKIAAAATLIITGFLIGRITTNSAAIPVQTNIDYDYRSIYLEKLSNEFIRKSQIIILELLNSDPSENSPVNSDFSKIRTVSQQLINSGNTIRENIDNSDNNQIVKFIEDIEPVLLQLANIDNNKINILKIIKDGIRENGILFKIEIISMDQKNSVNNKIPEINNSI